MNKNYFTLLRITTSLIFLYAGFNHLQHPDGILTRLAETSVFKVLPNREFFRISVLLSGVLMIIASLSLISGYQKKWAAYLLLLMLLPITLSVQLENLANLGPFFKNVAIAGSLLFIIKKSNYDEKNSAGNYDRLAV